MIPMVSYTTLLKRQILSLSKIENSHSLYKTINQVYEVDKLHKLNKFVKEQHRITRSKFETPFAEYSENKHIIRSILGSSTI